MKLFHVFYSKNNQSFKASLTSTSTMAAIAEVFKLEPQASEFRAFTEQQYRG